MTEFMELMENEHQLWFTRRNGEVRGPYPERLIRSYLLLGRLRMDDEVSLDQQRWYALRSQPHLIPVEFYDTDTPEGRERLLQAKRREDERSPERRARPYPDELSSQTDQRAGDRRRPEPPELVSHRYQRVQLLQSPKPSSNLPQGPRLWIGLAVGLLGLLLLLWLGMDRQEPDAAADCLAPAQPGVNWSYCRMVGMDLRGQDLTGANLSNADLLGAKLSEAHLVGADLGYADLRRARLDRADLSGARLTGAMLQETVLTDTRLAGADLSHADLRGARLDHADLTGAILSRTLWTDGRVCASGSIGTCESP